MVHGTHQGVTSGNDGTEHYFNLSPVVVPFTHWPPATKTQTENSSAANCHFGTSQNLTPFKCLHQCHFKAFFTKVISFDNCLGRYRWEGTINYIELGHNCQKQYKL